MRTSDQVIDDFIRKTKDAQLRDMPSVGVATHEAKVIVDFIQHARSEAPEVEDHHFNEIPGEIVAESTPDWPPLPKKKTGMTTLSERVAESGLPPEDFTCFTCQLWQHCGFAFDGYNTNGDCLAEK